ncbi:MAG: threonine--tRNA ligase [Dehalococcoidia bacterium]|nr:threonine--tRNA ligase [Dehalococcoidia bacterium]
MNEHDTPFDELPADERLFRMRHSAAHVLAEAVLEMFPEAKYAIGPPVENGFYYDFDLPRPLTPDDLVALEARMRVSVARDLPIRGEQIPKARAREVFKDQPYKLELIEGIEDETVGYFRHGEFQDLCRGGHTERTGQLGAFALDRLAGAYWRGDEKNAMLQRVYGLLFPSTGELDAYRATRAEAERRDHRRLGRELDLFHLDPISPGSPFFHPKGAVLYNELIDYMRGLYREYGYDEVITPQMFSADLFKTSGHYDNFKDDMYMLEIDEQEFGLKPMNCPGHCALFRSGHYSYRDLPLRLAEFTRLHRNERSGVLHGMTRVRSFSQDDSHIYCTPDQVEHEIRAVFEMARRIYEELGLGLPVIRLATRPERFAGNIPDWDVAERQLGDSVRSVGYEYTLAPGEGAFYGPKVEFHFRDAIGRSWQLGTLQIDVAMPTRFGLQYTGADGEGHTPMMLHRAILGSLERFIGVYTEHTAGHFPLWLAPVQAVVVPIADRHVEYAHRVRSLLRERGLRIQVDESNERMGAKIRRAQLQRVPYMLVVGDREQEAEAAAVRDGTGADLGAMPVFQIIDRMVDERDSRAIYAGPPAHPPEAGA